MGSPTWMYRKGELGGVEGKVFDSDNLPSGWVDSPAKVEVEAPKRKPGRPRKNAPES